MNDQKLRKIQVFLKQLVKEGVTEFVVDPKFTFHACNLLNITESYVPRYLKDMVDLKLIEIDGEKFKIVYCK